MPLAEAGPKSPAPNPDMPPAAVQSSWRGTVTVYSRRYRPAPGQLGAELRMSGVRALPTRSTIKAIS